MHTNKAFYIGFALLIPSAVILALSVVVPFFASIQAVGGLGFIAGVALIAVSQANPSPSPDS
jgi:uncharacterized membrane protein YgdD (TMEM256/DUF423 family)